MRFVSLMLLAACLPARHSLVGARCSDSDPCPDPLHCVFGVCSESVPPDELLAAWDFEAGYSGWVGRNIATSPDAKRDGGASLKIAAREMVLPSAKTDDNALPKRLGLYCARAWALHGVGAGAIRAALNTYDPQGALITAGAPATLTSPAAAFRELKVETFVDGGAGLVKLEVDSSSTGAADFFYVDDVSVIRTASVCP